jgi:hypothetical protein
MDRYQADFDAAWDLCKRWHRGPDSLWDINRAEQAAKAVTDSDQVRRAYDALTRAQSRIRREMLETVDSMATWSTDGLDDEEAYRARLLVRRLARCPKPRGPASPGGGPAS